MAESAGPAAVLDKYAVRYDRRLPARVRRSGRLDGPGEVRGAQPGADRVALVVGQPDAGDEAVARAHRLGDEAGRHVGEAELGAAEHLQRAVAGHVSPDQAEVAVGPVAADGRAGEVVAIV